MNIGAQSAPTLQEKRGTPPQEDDVRRIIQRAMKGRRHIVAARMSKILGRDVTPGMLADFCRKSPGKRHSRFPAAWVRAFCEAVNSDELATHLLPESARSALAASAMVIEARAAVAHAQAILGCAELELSRLAECKEQEKPARSKR